MQLSTMLGGGKGADMTSFFSLLYLLAFLPGTFLAYAAFPQKARKYVLLAASYLFFWLVSGELVIFLIMTTIEMHYFGLWLDRIQGQMKVRLKETEKEERKAVKQKYMRQQRRVVFLSIVLMLGFLLTVKYSGFFTTNINTLLKAGHATFRLAVPRFLMPVGISFFTLQAMSYVFDVQRGVIKADDNLLRLSLFLSFFPQIVEGPIVRYSQTAQKLWEGNKVNYANVSMGLQRIAYGMMKKVVVADRLNPMVKNIFENYAGYEGGVIAFGALAYTVQLYMDFSGSMDAVLGTAQIFGIELPENFRHPFFSKTISEFWKRWHITLGTWFRDYVFYPVTTAKPMKKLTSSARKKIGNHYGPLLAGGIALLCVWLGNGLWHGAAWNYIFFGLYHFVLILGGSLIAPVVGWTNKHLHINSKSYPYRVMQMVRTGLLVIIGELFFRALTLKDGFEMFKKMITQFAFKTFDHEFMLSLGIDRHDLAIVGLTILIVFIISVLSENGILIRETLMKKNIILRWAIIYTLIAYIVVFGAYGFGYQPVDPMYAQF